MRDSRESKRGSNYMQKAIEKASKLIELLTKENTQLKQDNINLQTQLDQLLKKSKEVFDGNKTNQGQIKKLESQIKIKDSKIKEYENKIRDMQEKVLQKTHKNKQLHQKLGQFVSKNQQLTKSIQKQRKKNLALQNQNQYLIKTFSIHQHKQNQFQNYCYLAQQQFKKQITMVDRTKQAFSRKCQQLKLQNCNMRRQILLLTQKIQILTTNQTLFQQNKQKYLQLQKQIKRTNDALTYIIQSTLRIKAQIGLYLKVEQIKNYIGYRLQHIQNLIKPIIDILENVGVGNNLKQFKDLDSLNSIVNRLSMYLGQLLK